MRLLLPLLLLLSACARPVPAPQACPPGQDTAIRLELYFGLSKPDGSEVSEAEWAAFHRETILPAFPDGMTLLAGSGHWRDESGALGSEPSRLLVVLLFERGGLEERVARVSEDYKARFQQQSVLSVESEACAAFR